MVQTNSIANASSQLTIDPGGASDSFIQFNESTTGKWRQGNDATDDSYRLSQGSALGTSDTFIMTSAGERTMPLQPAFLATHTIDQLNVTGNGTATTVNYTSEIVDQGTDYDGTNTFTCPVSGFCSLKCSVLISQATGGTSGRISLVTSNRNYDGALTVPVGANCTVHVTSVLCDMDAMDVASGQASLTGIGADTANFANSATNGWFCGALIC